MAPGDAEAAVIPGPATNNALARRRANLAYATRRNAALYQRSQPLPLHPDNGDEAAYANKIGSFHKGLPHDSLGEVDPAAFQQLRRALIRRDDAEFEAIPLGGARKLANPQATYTYSLEGADSHALTMPAAPAFASEDNVAEIVEVYWHALLRDIPFDDYATNPLAAAAVADLNQFSYFTSKYPGGITTDNLFRGETDGDLNGHYVSQFLLKDIPFGATSIEQRYNVESPNFDFMTSYDDWLEVQRGNVPFGSSFDPTPRYIYDARSLGSYVHFDFTYQAYLSAAQIIAGGLGINPWAPNLPYANSATQGRFVTFGGGDLLTLIAKAAHEALKTAWYQKWQAHLRLRPETFGGRIHNHLTGAATYPIDGSLYNVNVFNETFSQTGTYLLPMAYPEGSPTHPAYPAGHACVAGACCTILKAFFDNDLEVPDPQVPTAGGLGLQPYVGAPLTLGGEINKLAANISLGRDLAGVHWRTDGIEGLIVGEEVAIRMLKDIKRVYNEDFPGFTFRDFSDNVVNV
ncbi:MAG: vanadium-dependent haloperoxidase [Woeseiaceae bacterium]|nr:vanadium-dependent haloperoxidase [Woeseiaceae bacterium]